jgi:putative peptidoglycan lipid II flippase
LTQPPENRRKSQGRVVGVASAIWAASIFLSRVMGLAREQVVGRTLGASREADIYFASFTLPDFLNYLLAAGALSIVFIPIFLSHCQRGDEAGAWRAFSIVANFLAIAGLVSIVALMVFAQPLAGLVAPGLTDPRDVETLTRLTRIILPAQFFHVIGGLLSATLMARNLHLLPALAPLVYSASIIAGGLIGAHFLGFGAEGFAWGTLIGSVLGPFALPLFGCLRSGMRWRPTLSLRDPDLLRYLWLSLPIMLGFSIVAVDEWIIKNQASYLDPGSISYLQYARTLMKTPMGVFGMATGVAAYPTLSRLVSAGEIVEAYHLLSRAVRLMLAATFGAQVCLTVAGFEAVYLIWGLFAKRFTVDDAQMTASTLAFLSLGLAGWSAQTVISRGFYALGSTWPPTLLGTAIAVAVVPLYVVLREAFGEYGLAIASALAITIYVLLLGGLQRLRFEREAAARGATLKTEAGMLAGAVRLGLAAVMAIGLTLAARPWLLQQLPGLGLWALVSRGAALCALGLILYATLARMLGVPEIGEALSMTARRLRPRASA